MPKTDIVMISWSPTDRRMRYFKESLHSLQQHTKIPYRLILIDNGPEEQTEWLSTQSGFEHVICENNIGVGPARNLGLSKCQSEYVAIVDNDIGYFDGWLGQIIDCLKRYPDRKLIATPVVSKPMRQSKYQRGSLDEYRLYSWASCMALAARLSDVQGLGCFDPNRTNVGERWNRAMRCKKFQWVHHPDWNGKPLDRQPTYHYKRQKFVNGEWITREGCQWSPTKYANLQESNK